MKTLNLGKCFGAVLALFISSAHAAIQFDDQAPSMVCRSKHYLVIAGTSDSGLFPIEGVIYYQGHRSSHDFEVAPRYDEHGNVTYVLGTFLDLKISRSETVKKNAVHYQAFLEYVDGPAGEYPSEYAICVGLLK